jgi:hypothetical protein
MAALPRETRARISSVVMTPNGRALEVSIERDGMMTTLRRELDNLCAGAPAHPCDDDGTCGLQERPVEVESDWQPNEVQTWLDTPEGEAWEKHRHQNCTRVQGGLFGEIKEDNETALEYGERSGRWQMMTAWKFEVDRKPTWPMLRLTDEAEELEPVPAGPEMPCHP